MRCRVGLHYWQTVMEYVDRIGFYPNGDWRNIDENIRYAECTRCKARIARTNTARQLWHDREWLEGGDGKPRQFSDRPHVRPVPQKPKED